MIKPIPTLDSSIFITNLSYEFHDIIVNNVSNSVYYKVLENIRTPAWDICQGQLRHNVEIKIEKEH